MLTMYWIKELGYNAKIDYLCLKIPVKISIKYEYYRVGLGRLLLSSFWKWENELEISLVSQNGFRFDSIRIEFTWKPMKIVFVPKKKKKNQAKNISGKKKTKNWLFGTTA